MITVYGILEDPELNMEDFSRGSDPARSRKT
jgi:hypothetical protein